MSCILLPMWPLLLGLVSVSASSAKLETVFEWTRLAYEGVPSPESASESGLAFNDPANNVPAAVRRHKDSLYVSVPRWKNGVPATLNVVSLANKSGLSPKLRPFPSLEANAVGQCGALQNVAALEVAPNGLLWVADSGSAAVFTSPIRKCPAKLVCFDLNYGGVEVARHDLPEEIVPTAKNSVLGHLVLDFSAGADDLYVYASDLITGALVVVSARRGTARRLRAVEMTPRNTRLHIGTMSVEMRFGLDSIAIEAKKNLKTGRLFFGTLERSLYSLPSEALRDESVRDIAALVEHEGIRGDSGSDAVTTDDDGNLYYGLLESHSVMTWNASSPPIHMKATQLVMDKRLRWINSLFVHDGYLWIVSNSFHLFTWHDLSAKQPNFGVYRLPLASSARNSYMHAHVDPATSAATTNIRSAPTVAMWSICAWAMLPWP